MPDQALSPEAKAAFSFYSNARATQAAEDARLTAYGQRLTALYADIGHRAFVTIMSLVMGRTSALVYAGIAQQRLAEVGRINIAVPALEDLPPDPTIGPGKKGDPGNLHLKGGIPTASLNFDLGRVDVEPEPEVSNMSSSTATPEETESTGPASFNFFTPGIMSGVSNPGAGHGGFSTTNEGGFATIDSEGNITNTITGESIGNSTVSGTGPSNSGSMGGNEAE